MQSTILLALRRLNIQPCPFCVCASAWRSKTQQFIEFPICICTKIAALAIYLKCLSTAASCCQSCSVIVYIADMWGLSTVGVCVCGCVDVWMWIRILEISTNSISTWCKKIHTEKTGWLRTDRKMRAMLAWRWRRMAIVVVGVIDVCRWCALAWRSGEEVALRVIMST